MVSNISAAINLQGAAVFKVNRYSVCRNGSFANLFERHVGKYHDVAVMRSRYRVATIAIAVEEGITRIAADK